MAENLTSETAADVAERCGGKPEIIEMLRAAEGKPNKKLFHSDVS